jgi:hypothetical protein
MKALLLIVVMLFVNLIEDMALQPVKQSLGIDFTLVAFNISKLVIHPNEPKQPSDNVVIVLGKTNAPLKGAMVNAYLPIKLILDSPQSKFTLFELKYD